MPTYTFQCESCNIRFRRLVSTSEIQSQPCPQCTASSSRQMSTPSAKFSSTETMGDTGVYDLDYNPDKNVGRDAQLRWETIKDRESQKRRVRHDVLKSQGLDPYDAQYKVAMKKTEEGEYLPMSRSEVGAYRTLRRDFNESSSAHRAQREAKGIPQVEPLPKSD